MKPGSDWIPHSRPTLDGAEAEAVRAVVESGFVGTGKGATKFESDFAGYIGRKHGRATTTGSAALHLALLAAGAGPGEAVIVPALVCRALLNVVLSTGAHPVIADIDPVDLNVGVQNARRAAESPRRPRFMIAVHSFGAPVDISAFESLGLTIIEDAASSLGARIDGNPVGRKGLSSVFSFGSTKMITTGQGGMVLTDDTEQLARLDALRDYDCALIPSGGSQPTAFNYGMADLQAALGMAQLVRLDEFVARRREIAKRYSAMLSALPGVELPHGQDSDTRAHSYYRYVLLHDRAVAVVAAMNAKGIDARTSVTHFISDHVDPLGDYSGCRAVRSRIVSLPIYPSLTDADVDRIASAAAEALAG